MSTQIVPINFSPFEIAKEDSGSRFYLASAISVDTPGAPCITIDPEATNIYIDFTCQIIELDATNTGIFINQASDVCITSQNWGRIHPLEGVTAAGKGIDIVDGRDVSGSPTNSRVNIRNLTIQGIASGITVTPSATTPPAEFSVLDLTVSDMHFSECNDPIRVASHLRIFEVYNSVFNDNQNVGIVSTANDQVKVRGNSFINNLGGIFLGRDVPCQTVGGRLPPPSASRDITISNNIFQVNTSYGINVTDLVHNLGVYQNLVDQNGEYGLLATNVTNFGIFGNVFTNNGTENVTVSSSTNVSFQNNDAVDAGLRSASFTDIQLLDLYNNTISNSETSGVEAARFTRVNDARSDGDHFSNITSAPQANALYLDSVVGFQFLDDLFTTNASPNPCALGTSSAKMTAKNTISKKLTAALNAISLPSFGNAVLLVGDSKNVSFDRVTFPNSSNATTGNLIHAMEGVSSLVVKHSTIIGGSQVGVLLDSVSCSTIYDNVISENAIGVLIEGTSEHNFVSNNKISCNSQFGVQLTADTTNNVVEFNSFLNNGDAIDDLGEGNFENGNETYGLLGYRAPRHSIQGKGKKVAVPSTKKEKVAVPKKEEKKEEKKVATVSSTKKEEKKEEKKKDEKLATPASEVSTIEVAPQSVQKAAAPSVKPAAPAGQKKQ